MFKLTLLQGCKIIALYIVLASTGFLALNVRKFWTPGKKRPFQCSDKSLAQPFVDDTVPTVQLHLVGIYFPVGLIVICELLTAWSGKKTLENCSWFLKFILRTIFIEILFVIGLAVERLYKNVAKIKMVRLRPNFITVCQPVNGEGHKCFDAMQPNVMSEYTCSASSYPDWAVKSAFLSFPSGHTSLTAYGMMFSICYLYLLFFKLKHTRTFSFLVILIMQVLCLFTILFVAVSRVLDFRHHWSDVGAGFIGGSCIALAINYYLLSQWENVENWLEEIMGPNVDEHETVESGLNSKIIRDNEPEVSTMELVNK